MIDDQEFIDSAWSGKAKYEAQWRDEGRATAWIDPHPQWVNASDWDVYALTRPEIKTTRVLRFILLGGGQIRVTEKFFGPEDQTCKQCRYGQRLLIKAETPLGIVQVVGRIEGFSYEMSMRAVRLMSAKHQDIADRVAATFRLILDDQNMPTKENFMAILDGSAGCAFCGRQLRDHISKLIGIGPDCARNNDLQHNQSVAGRVLARRRTLGLLPEHQP